MLTKAMYARHVNDLAVRLAREAASLAQGMWNPRFCESDAGDHVEDLCEEIRARLSHLETLAQPRNEAPPNAQLSPGITSKDPSAS